jgi:DNA polymerase-3 subunit chi
MTRIDFHVLPEDGGRRQHDHYLCQMVEQLWRGGRKVHLHCADEAMQTAFDELLWTFNDTSFLPHAATGTPEADAAAVTLGCGTARPASAEVLVNLQPEVPAFFSQFETVIETTGPDEAARAAARLRYRFYKDRGYPLEMVKV